MAIDRERDRAELARIHAAREQDRAAAAWYNAHQHEADPDAEPEPQRPLVNLLPVPDYGNPLKQAQAIRARAAQPTPMDEFERSREAAGIKRNPFNQAGFNDR